MMTEEGQDIDAAFGFGARYEGGRGGGRSRSGRWRGRSIRTGSSKIEGNSSRPTVSEDTTTPQEQQMTEDRGDIGGRRGGIQGRGGTGGRGRDGNHNPTNEDSSGSPRMNENRGGRDSRGGRQGYRERGGRGRNSISNKNKPTTTNEDPVEPKMNEDQAGKGGRDSRGERGGRQGRGGRVGRGRGGRSIGNQNKSKVQTKDSAQNASFLAAQNEPPPSDGNKTNLTNDGKGNQISDQEGNPDSRKNDLSTSENSNIQQSKQSKGKQNNNKAKSNSQVSSPKKGMNKEGVVPESSEPHAPSIPPSQPQLTNDINYGRNQKITVLHVGEKPSIAEAVAVGLSQGANISKRGSRLPVREFVAKDPFPKAPHASSVLHRVTSVAGHVFQIDFPSEFQNWDSVDPAELFTAKTVQKPIQHSVVKHLESESRGVDFLVLWNDCDREGENINFEVLSICQSVMKTGGSQSNYDRVYRAFFSAINPSDIQKAYKALGKPDRNQALSVDARQELDLKVGVAFSRFQTKYFQGRYGDLDSNVLSYGPCQTPTLGFCVQRHIDIETFKPEPYWSLELAMVKRGRALKALWDAGRSFNKEKVESLVTAALEQGAAARVAEVVTKEKKQGRPVPLNTVALLKACSKALGIGPQAALNAAEQLYLRGYLSYPRTESTAYPKSFDINGMLHEQIADNRWGSYVQQLLSTNSVTKARGGVDMGDHPPITPCRSARGGELSGDVARVYELVVRHCIASVSQDAVWKSSRVNFVVDALGDKGGFTLQGKELVSPGFLAVLLHKEYGDDNEGEESDNEEEGIIPEFSKDEVIPLINPTTSSGSGKVAMAISANVVRGTLNIKERMTVAPGYLTESELIGKMEKHGIGTDASIPTHIQNIQNRKYATLESGRRLKPTKLGLVLVQGYHQFDSSLVLPQVRSDIEQQCVKIAKGSASKDDVVEKALKLFREKYDKFVKNIDKMDVLFGASFAKLEEVGKPFTRCGLTRRYLSYIPGPPVRLYNKWTETVYPLPAGGDVKQWTGRNCTVEGCNFELCLYSVGQPARTFPLCPRCFNDPDWALEQDAIPCDPVDKEDEGKERKIQKMAGRQLVLECPLPDNHPLIEEFTVSPDPDSDGVMIVDPHLGPKWRLVSTRAPTIIYLPQQISKITVLNKLDDVMGVRLMRIEFKDGQSPLPDGVLKYISCFPNDEVLQALVRVYHGSERSAGRQGGRGRGTRGRGGGRGRSGRGGRR